MRVLLLSRVETSKLSVFKSESGKTCQHSKNRDIRIRKTCFPDRQQRGRRMLCKYRSGQTVIEPVTLGIAVRKMKVERTLAHNCLQCKRLNMRQKISVASLFTCAWSYRFHVAGTVIADYQTGSIGMKDLARGFGEVVAQAA